MPLWTPALNLSKSARNSAVIGMGAHLSVLLLQLLAENAIDTALDTGVEFVEVGQEFSGNRHGRSSQRVASPTPRRECDRHRRRALLPTHIANRSDERWRGC